MRLLIPAILEKHGQTSSFRDELLMDNASYFTSIVCAASGDNLEYAYANFIGEAALSDIFWSRMPIA